MTADALTDQVFERLFTTPRTANAWQGKPVSNALLQKIFDSVKLGPTSANCSPLRIVFVKTPQGKARLKPALAPGNVEKTMTAPVTVIFAHDLQFYDHLSFLFPHADARSWFAGNDKVIQSTAFRNGTLQAAYFILAARAAGLADGAMSGFDEEKVNGEFFADGRFKVNFLCNFGYPDHSKTFPRSPRFGFDSVCSFV